MEKLITVCLLLAATFVVNAQESFKKKYFIPTKLANDIYLKKDTIVMYDAMTDKEKDEVIKKYIDSDYVEGVSEEIINGNKVMVTRRIKIDHEFFKSLTKTRTVNVTQCGIQGFVKLEDNGRLIVNRFLEKDNNDDYTRYPIHYYQLLNRQTVSLSFREWAVSAIVIPIKYRFKGRNGLKEDFSTVLNANLFGGYTWGKTNFFHQEKVGNKQNTHKYTLGIFLGTSTIVLDENNTSLDTNPMVAGEKQTKGIATFGIGATYAFNKINLGLFGGSDYAIGANSDKWNYNKEPWIGLAIGYSLFNF